MKTKDLIALLQKEDPSGELECCIGNADITSVYTNPGYWDGCLQILERNEKGQITGGKFASGQTKVVLRYYSIRDCVVDNPSFKVSFDGEYSEKHYAERVEEWRKYGINLQNDVERDIFVRYMMKRLNNFEDAYTDDIKEASIKFYNENLSYDDEMPKDILTRREKRDGYEVIPSWADRREAQWDREVMATIVDGAVVLTKSEGIAQR